MFRNMDAELKKAQEARLTVLQMEINNNEDFGVDKVQQILGVGHHTAKNLIDEGIEISVFVKSTNKPWLVQLN